MKLLLFALLLAIPVLAQNDQQGPCYDERGNEARCSDGKFHAHDGTIQPDTCNNNYQNANKCECAIAMTDADHCPPGGITRDYRGMGPNCLVSCREEACKCVNLCDATEGK